MITSTTDIKKAFDTLQTNLPIKWLSPKLEYNRWRKYRRNWYRDKPFHDLKIDEGQLRIVLESLKSGRRAPEEATTLLGVIQSNYISELIRVLTNSLDDKVKKREYLTAKAIAKEVAKERKAKAKIAAAKEKAKLQIVKQEKRAKVRAKAKKIADKKKAVSKKNITLLKSLFLTPEQKAILKKIAG